MDLYKNIKEAAKLKGYSINRLEKELNFSRSYISKFKTITPSAEKIQKIADFLNVSVDYLMTGTDTAETQRPSQSNPDMTEDEKQLLKQYSSLNESDKALIRAMVQSLFEKEKHN